MGTYLLTIAFPNFFTSLFEANLLIRTLCTEIINIKNNLADLSLVTFKSLIRFVH